MKFLSIFTPDPSHASVPPSPEKVAEIETLVEESKKSGGVLMTGGMLPLSRGGAVVRSAAGKITVIDGPFTESKELFVGWSIFEAGSREEAIEGTRKFLEVVGDGQCELRQITEGPDDGE